MTPQSAIDAGAMWRRVGTTTWYHSGYTESGVTPSTITVEFKPVPGYTTPANVTKNLPKPKDSLLMSGNYVATTNTGSLQVTLAPQGAVGAGARWRRILSNGTTTQWFTSGYTETNIAVFSYQIEFKAVTGWIIPAQQSVTITSGATATATGTYIQQPGTLQAVIQPDGAAIAGAAWSIDGGTTWRTGGDTISVAPGAYTVTYKAISGWNTPVNQSVTVPTNGAATTTGTYVQQPGTLQVVIDPAEAASAGAQWSINNGTTWHSSAVSISIVPSAYTVKFKSITRWDTPASQSITVPPEGFTTTGTYVSQTGSLNVSIMPFEAVSAGAQWSIDGGSSWHDSGIAVDAIPLGSYTLLFSVLAGWTAPPDQTVTISQGSTATATATYVKQTGTLQVILTPAGAVSAGAQWSIDGGSNWYDSGVTLSRTAGNYTVSFTAVAGYGTPVDQYIVFTSGEILVLYGFYTFTWYADADGDGYGDLSVTTQSALQPSGYVTDTTDCDDDNALINPAAAEACNSIDDNCNGQTDEYAGFMWYYDADGDGYGNAGTPTRACSQPTGYVADSTDCDDSDNSVHPGVVTEACNGKDDNCDGQTDEVCLLSTYYRDVDGDGYGNPLDTTAAGAVPVGYTALSTDCDDTDGLIHPGAQERCNGKDDNCEGTIDTDNTSLAQITFYRDSDGDFYGSSAVTTIACMPPTGYVADSSDCYDSQVRYADSDGDGYGSTTMVACGGVSISSDCDDGNAAVHPGAGEACNGIDDNCNGATDEGCSATTTTTQLSTTTTSIGGSTTTVPLSTTTVPSSTTTVSSSTTTVVSTSTTTIGDDCIDVDSDGYGEGEGCLGPDCNDSDDSLHDNCTACTVKVFPRRISKLFSAVKPFAVFIFVSQENNSFSQQTRVHWNTGAVEGVLYMPLGIRKRLLFGVVHMEESFMQIDDEYVIDVGDCTCTVKVTLY